MIQDIGANRFDNQYRSCEAGSDDRIIVFAGTKKSEDEVLVRYDDKRQLIAFPTRSEVDAWTVDASYIYLFSIDGVKFFLLEHFDGSKIVATDDRYSYQRIHVFRAAEPLEFSFLGVTAYHLYEWYRGTQFCGKCGHKLVHDEKERMMICPSCGKMHFPKICPAVIVAVRNGDSVMMTRYAGREYKGRALLAGFCEIGETPEETVVREVYEEIGVKVENVQYYKSQPWGFDSDLLLGFYCDAVGDTTICMDHEELAIAEWVSREEIPEETNLRSLTATMIQAFRNGEI